MPSSACLEIHVINVGQGESILIINRDLVRLRANLGNAANAIANDIDLQPQAVLSQAAALQGTVKKALLIDGGEDMYGESVVEYLVTQGVLAHGTVNAPNLYVLMTHYHSDHIGGLPYLFITLAPITRNVDKRQRIAGSRKFETISVPVTTWEPVARFKPGRLYYAAKTTQDNVIRAYSLVFQWADAAANVTGKVAIQAGGLDPAAMQQEPLVISLGTGIDNIPIKLRAVAAIAKVWDPETSTLRDVPVKNVDPNDRSVVLMLEYGSFRAFLGADIAGNGVAAGGNGTGNYAMNAASKKPFSQHGDVESVLMPVIKKIYPRTTQPQAGRPKFSIDGVSTVYRSAITAAPPATISIHWAGSPRALP